MQTQVLVSGLAFGEGPRWHEDELWLSDMHAHQVLRVSTTGEVSAVVEVEQAPSGLGWLPGGDLLIVSMTDRRLLRWDGDSLSLHCDLSDITLILRRGTQVEGRMLQMSETAAGPSITIKATDGKIHVIPYHSVDEVLVS